MYKTNWPACLWDYGMSHVAAIVNRAASNLGNLDKRTPLVLITVETPDISEYLDFSFIAGFSFVNMLGLDLQNWQDGQDVNYSRLGDELMDHTRKWNTRTLYHRVTKLEAKLDVNKERFDKCDSKIKKRFKGDRLLPEKGDFPSIYKWEETFYDDKEYLDEFMRVHNNSNIARLF